MTRINQLDLLLKSVRRGNKNQTAHGPTFMGEQFCLAWRLFSIMLSPSHASWWGLLPSWGWRCTGYWWCCWTSPVPLGDSSCETGDCCQRERERKATCYHSLSSVYHLFYMFAVQLTPQLQCQQGTFPVYGSSLSSTVVRWRVDLNTSLCSTVFPIFFHSNQVTHWLLKHMQSSIFTAD